MSNFQLLKQIYRVILLFNAVNYVDPSLLHSFRQALKYCELHSIISGVLIPVITGLCISVGRFILLSY